MQRAVTCLALCALALPSGGCARTLRFPASAVPALRPLMASTPQVRRASVVIETDEGKPVRFHDYTRFSLHIWDGVRTGDLVMQAERLSYHEAGVWVGETFVPAANIRGMSLEAFDFSTPFLWGAAIAGAAVVVVFVVFAAAGGPF